MKKIFFLSFIFLNVACSADITLPPQVVKNDVITDTIVEPSGEITVDGSYFKLNVPELIPNIAGIPAELFKYFPDAHISTLKEKDGKYSMIWSGAENFRTIGSSPLPEDQKFLQPTTSVLDFRDKTSDVYYNGGMWLMSVFRQDEDKLLGFYHAEDHWPMQPNPNWAVWKSIGRTTSTDNGFTWNNQEQIITAETVKPLQTANGGAGDFGVVWDKKNSRWICYYQEGFVYMAMSSDPEGKPGTWYKYYEGDFTEPGIGGKQSKIPGLEDTPGANPSIHFNTYLNEYVMVWGGWDPAVIYISKSEDLIHWDKPEVLANYPDKKLWYPTIIGESDQEAGMTARLYYTEMDNDFSNRKFKGRTIVFNKN